MVARMVTTSSKAMPGFICDIFPGFQSQWLSSHPLVCLSLLIFQGLPPFSKHCSILLIPSTKFRWEEGGSFLWIGSHSLGILDVLRKDEDKQDLKSCARGTSDQIRSVAQSCPTLCDPMNRSTPGLPVNHQLLEFTQTHVHRVSDAIQPSHPLSSPSPPAPNPSQHQSLFQ